MEIRVVTENGTDYTRELIYDFINEVENRNTPNLFEVCRSLGGDDVSSLLTILQATADAIGDMPNSDVLFLDPDKLQSISSPREVIYNFIDDVYALDNPLYEYYPNSLSNESDVFKLLNILGDVAKGFRR